MSKIKFIALLLLALATVLPASAVLKEKNLEGTLGILRSELTDYYNLLEQQGESLHEQQQSIGFHLMDIYNRSAQNSLMLYSQRQDNVFSLTYACHEATEMYTQFQRQTLPFRQFIENNSTEIARYDSLIVNLSHMPVMRLSDDARINRNVCLTLAISIRRTLNEHSEQMADYINYYQRTEERLRTLNDYAMKRYDDIQSSIFVNGGDSYFSILGTIGKSVEDTWSSVSATFKPHKAKERSQWDIKVMLMLLAILLVYGFISVGLNVLILRYLLPKRFHTTWFVEKQRYIIMATSVVTLAIILGVLRLVLSDQYFIIMASGLMVEYAWLLGVILISLLLRLGKEQIKSAFHIYAPLVLIGFLVISFRIVLVPNTLVNLLFPPILLSCTLWQWYVIKKYNKNIPHSDVYYTYISLLVFLTSVVFSWVGYTLLSVQILIWWIMQLTCILTITCISTWMKSWADHKNFNRRPITETWFYNLCRSVMLPSLGVASIVIAIYWAADVFNLSDTTWMIFTTKFIDSENFSASIYGLSLVVALYFLFAYINRSIKELLAMHFERSDHSTAASRNVLAKNVVQIVVWGVWALIVMNILHVGNSWLLVVSGGLSTGIGFASKDILENIYYGISLMTGRVKIGDLIECDGYRGRVSSINYTSTMLNVVDGSVIAFQNSQLFTKNYKNLTKSYGYELVTPEVGVAYGSDINQVRELLIEAVSKLPFLEKNQKVGVIVTGLGDSSVDLKVTAWVPVATRALCNSQILECIYNTLNSNGIEIPFPQVDVHNK